MRFFKLLLLLSLGVLLMAASFELPNYWQSPVAATSTHDWSALEKNMRPEACAQCHESQFNDWKQSRHAKAFSPGMVGQFADMRHSDSSDCLRCHAPLAQQLYRNQSQVLQSLNTLKQHKQGMHMQADLEASQAQLPLRHAGVSCAVCHVRDGQRFGPPRRGENEQGLVDGPAHGGFIASSRFKSSNFCAECHQFPQSYAINGKPLENTVQEWQQSRYADAGQQCQSCHMPDRQHQFKGIHDYRFTRQGLDIQLSLQEGMPRLSMTSTGIGHAFPTYVTPKVSVQAIAKDKQGEILQTWQWTIGREVFYANGWQEKYDTRLLPDEKRVFLVKNTPEMSEKVTFVVRVIPDYFYKGVYQSLLQGDLQADAKVLIKRALYQANQSDYVLYQQSIGLP